MPPHACKVLVDGLSYALNIQFPEEYVILEDLRRVLISRIVPLVIRTSLLLSFLYGVCNYLVGTLEEGCTNTKPPYDLPLFLFLYFH
ncbi:hypothetical protein BDV38DRAFT_237509 [Aspergillus pseudotamarii]|uniref:Uncharacterized protein n=1 Tax=Aspergillus pseudotamarii TaxID=132259 RepID=A0A5N6T4T8_ASPPS|nr:uncharacterized protein BDV38DRAFT_237509 [Aspergillus pseudotamarii]KAE8141211.1 hypothetical protein BDV38DRAFT_237509 [Aspergillus pseudotamarii]